MSEIIESQEWSILFSDSEWVRDIVTDVEGKVLTNSVRQLSYCNVFIGSNNSRKSRLLRSIYKGQNLAICDSRLRDIIIQLRSVLMNIANRMKNNDHIKIRIAHQPQQPTYFTELTKSGLFGFYNYADKNKHDTNIFSKENIQKLCQRINEIDKGEIIQNLTSIRADLQNIGLICQVILDYELSRRLLGVQRMYHFEMNRPSVIQEVAAFEEIRIFISFLDEMNHYTVNGRADEAHFIPAIRSVHALYISGNGRPSPLKEDVINLMLYARYKIAGNKENGSYVHTGYNIYDDVLLHRNSDRDNRKRIERFQEFVAAAFFPGSNIEIIASLKNDDRDVMIYFDDTNEERYIHNLGDGIQSLLLLLWPLFVCAERSWIFIEEPELHLHPGYQSLFIQTIMENEYIRSKKLKIFMTTHSNHFLDILVNSSEAALFKLVRSGKNESELVRVKGRDITLLSELGVGNTSVFIANASIWVEGISDRNFIDALIQLNQSSGKWRGLKENIDYAFFEYGGSNIAHYIFDDWNIDDENEVDGVFAKSLSNRIWLLMDKDEREWKTKRYNKLKSLEANGLIVENTGGIELENIYPLEVMKDILKDIFRVEGDRVDRIIKSEEDYMDKRLGSYLTTHKLMKPDVRDKYFEKNGTAKVGYKVKMSLYMLNGVRTGKYSATIFENSRHARRILESLDRFLR